jgi:L-alanine-DL-glutamate epimerase-like enolase superfamily enzyme
MKIAGFDLYPLPFRFVSGGFTTAYGARTHLNNLLLILQTDSGLVGLGEICRKPGNSPEPMAADRVGRYRSALSGLVGADPLDPGSLISRLGALDNSFTNLSSAVETAAFDLMAKSVDLPLWEILGGRLQDSVPVYHSIGQAQPAQMAAEVDAAQQQGCRVLQVKVGAGGGTHDDIACIEAQLTVLHDDAVMLIDANGGWDVDTALAVIARCGDERIYWEEPCTTYAENRRVGQSGAAVILDQCVSGPEIAELACRDGAIAGIGIKCTMQGGMQAGRRSRDLAIQHGLKLKVDDSWSADVACAASLHLALAVPPEQLISSVDMRPYFHGRISVDGPTCEAYRFIPNALPGLGLVADLNSLGKPLT